MLLYLRETHRRGATRRAAQTNGARKRAQLRAQVELAVAYARMGRASRVVGRCAQVALNLVWQPADVGLLVVEYRLGEAHDEWLRDVEAALLETPRCLETCKRALMHWLPLEDQIVTQRAQAEGRREVAQDGKGEPQHVEVEEALHRIGQPRLVDRLVLQQSADDGLQALQLRRLLGARLARQARRVAL